MTEKPWAPPLASVVVYALVTVILGREVLSQLDTSIVHDQGDPLLTAAILHWNARHIPFTDAWWQFPIFYPTRDALTFSEHLLGLSVISAPIDWLTGDALVAYNLVTLLTFPLCAAAMYALTYHLTGSAGGAFIAGLAFGFAPYRITHLPHVQCRAGTGARSDDRGRNRDGIGAAAPNRAIRLQDDASRLRTPARRDRTRTARSSAGKGCRGAAARPFGFYLFAALITWLLALGPTIRFMGWSTGIDGPFMWLLALPGATGLRVPARFWLMTVLCLTTVAGIVVAELLKGRRLATRAVVIAAVALAVLGDGWVHEITTQTMPRLGPVPPVLAGQVVIALPFGDPVEDVAAEWRAVTRGWMSVNGYSSYRPAHYESLRDGLELRDGAILTVLRKLDTLYIDVPSNNAYGLRAWLTTTYDDELARRRSLRARVVPADEIAGGPTSAAGTARPVCGALSIVQRGNSDVDP